jgi:ABC-2 type transport system ATP-binding protein
MIEARGLTKRYGDTLAVDDLSFTVRPGMVTGFLGPNGAGKSTTMRMILGLDRPTSGTALVSGQRYSSLKGPLHHVGALLDAKDVHPGRTARAHLRALAQSNGITSRRVDEVLVMTGLEMVAKKRIKGFSLGMSQRLGIAATMLGDPDVLMFDEPVNGLDPEGILWIRNFMRALAVEGRTVFVSSHLMSEMSQTAEHLIVIGRGKLLADVSTRDFIENSSTNAVRVRSPQAAQLERLLRADGVTAEQSDNVLLLHGVTTDHVGDVAAANQLTIHELFEERASLEAAFMEMTRDSVDYHAEVPSAATEGATR